MISRAFPCYTQRLIKKGTHSQVQNAPWIRVTESQFETSSLKASVAEARAGGSRPTANSSPQTLSLSIGKCIDSLSSDQYKYLERS
jgi:uncharacterized membrane protein